MAGRGFMAEADGNRNRQRQELPLSDFEDRAGHQTGYASHGPIMASLTVWGRAGGAAWTPRLPEAIEAMTPLNAQATRAGREAGVECATDITGFGLLGHLHKLARPAALGR
jgi:AIR synthase related protein, C-terminal domain